MNFRVGLLVSAKRQGLSLMGLLLLGVFSSAEALPRLIPREVLYGNPQRMSPQISPDGRWLAWISPYEGVLNVWVRELAENAETARAVTEDAKRGIRNFLWRGDSRHILYFQDNDGDENWNLFEVKLGPEGAEARNLTPGKSQVKVIAHSPQFPEKMVIAWNRRDARFDDAYWLDLNSGTWKVVAENPGDIEYFVADSRLRVRAALARLKDGSAEIRARDDETSQWRRLAGWTADDVDGQLLSFSVDDRAVWYISSEGSDTGRLLETDLQTGKTRVLASDRAGRFDAGRIMIHPTNRNLEAVEFNRDRRDWEAIDPSIAPDFAALRAARRGDFEVTSRDQADRFWTVSFIVDDGPKWFYLYDREKRSARPLFPDRPELESYKLAKMEPVSFRARDGLLLHGYLTLPALPADKQRQLPLIVYPHGGPYERVSWGLDEDVQLFANRGYAVLQINYRGSTGYGKKFLRAAFRERGGKMSTDLLDGKQWAIERGYADPKRTCMYGVSYGGYAVLVALAFTPDEFACGIEAYGASNLVSLLKSFPPWWTLYRLQWESRVGSLQEEEFLKSRSPLFRANRVKVPLLIGQGANDPRVIKAESDQMVAALRKSGKDITYIVFADEGHGFTRPENSRRWFAATEWFLARHLGGLVEPPAPEEDWKPLQN
jgi:dipeptidyl aminopeptidase/acylaminoacyl peptidase